MTININNTVFDSWRAFGVFLLQNDNFSTDCLLNFPPTYISSSNTAGNSLAGNPGNVFQTGQPAPFNFSDEPLEGGSTFKENVTTNIIRLRVYFSKRDWVKIGNIVLPAGSIQVIGAITDLAKFRAATSVRIFNNEAAVNMNYKTEGDIVLHGFGKKFFICYMSQM